MKKSIRQCISCIFPCGALDVIRIIHSDGRVQEITSGSGSIKASDVIKAHPKHVLKKPRSPLSDQGGIVIVPPEAELQRGKIYFLIPLPPSPHHHQQHQRRKKRKQHTDRRRHNSNSISMSTYSNNKFHVSDDRYLTELLSEKVSMSIPPRDRRRGRVAVWRPNLESISESP